MGLIPRQPTVNELGWGNSPFPIPAFFLLPSSFVLMAITLVPSSFFRSNPLSSSLMKCILNDQSLRSGNKALDTFETSSYAFTYLMLINLALRQILSFFYLLL